MKEGSPVLGCLFLIVIVVVVVSVLYFIGYNLPVWNGWTE